MINKIRHRLSHIIVAKEFFRIDDNFAIVRIDDDPEMLDEAAQIADECKDSILFKKSFDSIVLIRRNRYNTEKTMDGTTYSNILDRFIYHIQDAIYKIKK